MPPRSRLALLPALVLTLALTGGPVAAQDPPANACAAPSGPAETPAIPGGNEALTGTQPGPLPAGTPVACWVGASGNAVLGTRAAIVGELVVTLTDQGDAVAFAPDGSDAWRIPLAEPGRGLLGGLATDGTRVFVGSPTGLVALSAADGSTSWSAPIDPGPMTSGAGVFSPTMAGDSVVALVYTSDSRLSIERALIAYDPATGEERWSQPVFADLPAGAPSSDGVSVVLVEGDRSIVLRDAATGAEEVRVPVDVVGAAAITPVVLTGDRIIVGLTDGVVLALDREDGAERWRATLPSRLVAAVTAVGPLVIANGVTTLTALAADSGETRWEASIQAAPPPFPYQPIPAVVDGLVIVGTTDIRATGALLAFDAATGAPAWRVDLGLFGAIFSPVVAGERIYAPSFDLVGSGGVLAFGRPA